VATTATAQASVKEASVKELTVKETTSAYCATAPSRANNPILVNDPGGTNNNRPLYERLYGSQLQPAPVIADMATSYSSDKSKLLQKIRHFADAIRTPASIAAMELGTSTNTVIAFAGLETGWGKHIPGHGDNSSNNLFGIKAHNGNQPSITNTTTEYIDGNAKRFDQQFRSYQSIGESVADFSRFLRSNPRYDEALRHADDPKQFIRLVHKAGYATDPEYANKVIGALQQLDNITTKTGAIGIGWR